jgi:hypothetical protein
MNYEQFVSKLEKEGIEYTLLRFYSCTYVEVGRFGYGFDVKGNSAGGWIRNCNDNWRSEGQKWLALLRAFLISVVRQINLNRSSPMKVASARLTRSRSPPVAFYLEQIKQCQATKPSWPLLGTYLKRCWHTTLTSGLRLSARLWTHSVARAKGRVMAQTTTQSRFPQPHQNASY